MSTFSVILYEESTLHIDMVYEPPLNVSTATTGTPYVFMVPALFPMKHITMSAASKNESETVTV